MCALYWVVRKEDVCEVNCKFCNMQFLATHIKSSDKFIEVYHDENLLISKQQAHSCVCVQACCAPRPSFLFRGI